DVLPAADLIPVRGTNMLARVGPARTVLRGDVRPFQVERGNGPGEVRVRVAGPGQCRKAVCDRFGTAGNDRRAKATRAVGAADVGDAADLRGGERLGIEADAVT